jgi:non-specific protein-tyrosine kinase
MKLIKPSEKIKTVRHKMDRKRTTEVPSEKEEVPNRKWETTVCFEKDPIKFDFEKLAANRCICVFPNSPETEYYRILWANMKQHYLKNGWKTIMITSAYAKEGKTLTAINLAITLAKEFNQTALLVDCDLKRQCISQYLEIPSEKGIVDYLVDGCTAKNLIIRSRIHKLSFISGGKSVANSAELLGSHRMKTLVHELKNLNETEYVIFDAPPIIGWADIIAFGPLADCILMVVEEGRTSIQDVEKALEIIPTEKFLGFVLNRRKFPTNGYYY